MGRAGRDVIVDKLPSLIATYHIDVTIINGENAAGGRGITEAILNDLCDAGAHVITLGDHAFDQRETLTFIARHNHLIRPLNMPDSTPGGGTYLHRTEKGQNVLVINALGRVFMPPIDDPFKAVDAAVSACPLKDMADAIIVDFHCEATSEIQAMGHFLDGRASLVVGTHTHIPTADARVLSGGTALMSDAGMCGDYNSVIGMDKHEPIHRFIHGRPYARFEAATGAGSLCGVVIKTDDTTGFCTHIAPLRLGGAIGQALPDWWTS